MKTYKEFVNQGAYNVVKIVNKNTINENVTNLLKGKDLNDNQNIVYSAILDLKSIGMEHIVDLDDSNGVYRFGIIGASNNIPMINIKFYYYPDNREQLTSDSKNGWDIQIENGRSGTSKHIRLNDKNWKKLLVNIINICYPDIDSIIKNTKLNIDVLSFSLEQIKKQLNGMNNAKKILNNENI